MKTVTIMVCIQVHICDVTPMQFLTGNIDKIPLLLKQYLTAKNYSGSTFQHNI